MADPISSETVQLIPGHYCSFRAILDRSPDGVVVFDLEGRTIYCNEAYLRLTNAADRGTVLNVLSREFYADPDQDRPLVIRRLEAESTMEAHEIRVPESWAPVKWVELSVRQVKLDGHACFVSTVRDVGRRKKLEHERERIISVQQMLNETVLAGGLEEMIRSACERLAKVYGADWSGVALLQSDDEGEFFQYKWSYLVPPEIESIRFDRDGSSSLTSIVAEKGYAVVGDYQVEGPDAIPRRVESVRAQVRAVEAVALRDRQGDLVGVLSLFSSTPGIFREGVNEISLKLAARDLANLIEAKTLEDEIRLAGITDSLTGLYNTRHFYRRLSEEMNRARRTGAPLTVMLFDLDNFKEYNDSAGHVAGDHLLRRVGEIVTVSLRVGSDSAYRYGGDEFVALLPDTNVEGARRVALRISKKVRESKMAEVTVSLGMAEFQGEASPEELVRRADRAMYRAKESGKDRIMIDRPGEP